LLFSHDLGIMTAMNKTVRPNKIKSFVFVAVQFFCLSLLALTGPVIVSGLWLQLLEAAGILLGLWAIYTMRMGNFNITPDVRETGQLREQGPYRFIRHPMYASLLLTTLALLINAFTPIRLILWIVLLADLVLKLIHEESLLAQHFDAYTAYMSRTKRLLPFVY